MQRYFANISHNNVVLKEDDIFHITKVMRGKIGDHIEVVDSSSHEAYLCVIKSINPIEVVVQEPINNDAELKASVTLFFALAKSDKIEFVVQKATELGVKRIILFQGKRSIVKFSNEDFKKKYPRFAAIAKEASEQCHRQYIPEIIYLDNIKKVGDYLAELNLFAYELEASKSNLIGEMNKDVKSVSVIIGPEGGFDSGEAEYLTSLKFVPVSLGKRILRCETAAVYALSVISYLLEK